MRCALFVVSLVLGSYLLAVDAKKVTCDVNCAGNCKKSGEGKCDKTCAAGYLLDVASRTCLLGTSCASDSNCKRCADAGYCYLCAVGYKLSSNQCVAKRPEELSCDRFCTSGCTRGAGLCDDTCQLGFVLNTITHHCDGCDPNCDISTGCSIQRGGKCDSACMIGYTLDAATHKCLQCDLQCYSGCDAKGEARCDTECNLGYALDTTQYWTCVKCDENCAPTSGCAANGPSSCDTACNAGYTLNTVGSITTCDVAACDENCVSGCDVQKAGRCDAACKQGFMLFRGTMTCRPCGGNCAGSCDISGPGHCDGPCAPNHFLDTDYNACYPCDRHCSSGGCNSRGTCAGQCEAGYRLIDEHCHVARAL